MANEIYHPQGAIGQDNSAPHSLSPSGAGSHSSETDPFPTPSESRWQEHSSLREGLVLQARVVRALILREVKTLYGRHRLGYLWAFFEPIMHIAFWLTLMTVIRSRAGAHDLEPLLFLSLGLLPFLSFSHVKSFVTGAIKSNSALLQFPPVKQVDTMIARFLLESATMTSVSVGILALLILSGHAFWPAEPLGVFEAFGGMLFLGFGFGAFNCMVGGLFPTYTKFNNIISRVLYFTSGIFFVPETLPTALLEYLKWNPALHGVELMRASWSPLYESSIASLPYLLSVSTGMLLIGLALEPKLQRRRESE